VRPKPFVAYTAIMVRPNYFFSTSYCRHIIHGILAMTLLVGGRVALGGEIQIEGSRCSPEIRLVAREMRLSEVLAQLGRVLDFQLYFRSDSDPMVTANIVREPKDVVMQLTRSGNVSMLQGTDRKCNHGWQLLDVWVLNGRAAEQQQPAVPQLSQSPEQARLEQEAIDMYYKAHGVDRTHR
jgi:hypothetical protein